jgi:outer membrane protein assembly factor BamE
MNLRLFLLPAVMALGGCGVIYKVDVYQGNLLDEDGVSQLKTGLTKRQVQSLIGAPALSDPFHASRWDYISTVSRRGETTEVRNLVLTFDGDVLAKIEGDSFPEENLELMRRMTRYGNLAKEKGKQRR